jgi:hypothetical protein
MLNIQEVRAKYPQYEDLSDKQLLDSLHGKYYSDMPIEEFYSSTGFGMEQRSQALPPLTKRQQAADLLKSAPSALYKGASFVPGMAGDIEKLGQTFLPEWMTKPVIGGDRPVQVFPTSKDIRSGVEVLLPDLKELGKYKPQTSLGKFTQTVGEFATPGLLGKTKAASKLGVQLGAGGGAVYEGVEQATGSPSAATATSIPAMLTAGFLAGPSKAAKLAERALKDIPETELLKAIDLEEAARISGIKLLPGETIDDKMAAQLVEDILKTDRGSSYIYETIRNRPNEVKTILNKKANEIADMPESQRAVFKMIEDTAKTTINKAKTKRTSESQKAGYKVSNDESLSPNQVLDVIDNVDNIIKTQTSPNSPNRAKLLQIRKQLIEKETKVKGQKEKVITPVTNINKLDSTFKQYRDAVNNSNKDLVVGGERFIEKDLRGKLFNNDGTGVLDDLNFQLNTNPNYNAANQKYSELTEALVSVVEKNILPLSKKGLNLQKIESFIFNPKSANVDDINATLKILNKTDPEAVKQIANVYFRNAINQTFKTTKGGQDFTQGFKLVEKVVGTGQQRKNFLAVLDNVADANNVSRKDFKVGFENMLNVLERTGRISNLNKPGFDVKGIAAETLAKDLAMMKTFNPLVRLATKYGEVQANKAFGDLGKLMSNPESTRLLVELGRTNPKSKAAIIKTLTIIDSVAPVAERQEEQPQVPLGITPQ